MTNKDSTIEQIRKNAPDWDFTPILKFSTGDKSSFANGPFGSDLLSSELTSEGRPVVYIRDIQNGNYINKSGICVSEEKYNSLTACQVDYSDVIISKVGSPPCEAAIYNSEIEGIVTQDVIRIKCNSLWNSLFLKYLINSDIGKRYVKQIKISGTRERVSLTDFKKIILPKPSDIEQQKIAKILATWDKAISTTERLIDNSKQQKKALMQQLLTGKKRLLDDNGKPFEGKWEEVKLRECAISLDNKRVPLNSTERESMKGDIPYWGANGIQGYIDKYIFDEPIVLLAEDGGNFSEFSTRPIANISYGKAWVNNHAHVLKAKSNTTTEWLYYSLVHKNILAFVNGGTRAKLNKGDMLLIPILLPPIKEQQKIAAVLTNADKEIELLEQQLADLQQEKKALMQVLLTGKVRVGV